MPTPSCLSEIRLTNWLWSLHHCQRIDSPVCGDVTVKGCPEGDKAWGNKANKELWARCKFFGSGRMYAPIVGGRDVMARRFATLPLPPGRRGARYIANAPSYEVWKMWTRTCSHVNILFGKNALAGKAAPKSSNNLRLLYRIAMSQRGSSTNIPCIASWKLWNSVANTRGIVDCAEWLSSRYTKAIELSRETAKCLTTC